jgi:uncharacterized membrane protein YGL010W
MSFNSTTAIMDMFNIDPTEHYRTVSQSFGAYHLDPVNVLLHCVTTPIGLIGVFSLMHSYTKSSSMALSLCSVYLLSLLPAVPNGVFAGTVVLCGLIIFCARQMKPGFWMSILIIVSAYLIQDLAHLATGEETFQSTYSAGGQVSERSVRWYFMFYYLPMHFL